MSAAVQHTTGRVMDILYLDTSLNVRLRKSRCELVTDTNIHTAAAAAEARTR